jgi:two-component system, cell cycle sensor histidine kinase and response regulator CckA
VNTEAIRLILIATRGATMGSPVRAKSDQAFGGSQGDLAGRLEFALSAAGIGFWERDLRTGVTLMSGEYTRLHALPPNHPSMTHEEWLQMVHPDDRDRVDEQYRQSLERTHCWDTEFRLVWPDGSVHWILAKGQVFLDDLGRPVRLAGVSTEVTERKRVEDQRLRLASIVDSSEDAIFSKTLDGTIVSWNAGAEKLFGYTADEIVGKSVSLLLPSEWLHELPNILGRIQAGARLEHYEVTRMRKDGRRVDISMTISPIRDSMGVLIGNCGIARDITGRKQAETALRQSEERFRLAIQATNDAIWDIDLETGVVSWNDTYSRLYGRPPETSDSWQWWIDRIHPEDCERTAGELREAIRSGASSWICEYRFLRADGEWAYIYDRAYIARDASGKAWRVIGAMQDLTTRKKAEDELRRVQEETLARQKLESIGVLAGGIAHDFNNVLGGILAQAELAAAELAEGTRPLDTIQRISTMASRGAEIVRQLMIYSGQDRAAPEEALNVSRLVEEMLELLKVSVTKNATLETDLRHDIPAVRGRASQLRQIIMNLVINASEAVGEKGGTIKATTSHIVLPRDSGPAGPVDLTAGDYAKFEVSDTGAGMTQEVQAKIFDPFFTTKFAGRGLGLSVVQGIVRDHGGAINLISAPGQGTTIAIYLPCAGKSFLSSRETVQPAAVRKHRPASGTVLIVEDEDALRVAVTQMLRKKGFLVMEAGDGSSALELLRAHKTRIDAMLLDITLPGVSSREVFEESRKLHAGLKVILTSAYSRQTVDASFNGLPVEGFLRKPFPLADLVRSLQEALSGGSQNTLANGAYS